MVEILGDTPAAWPGAEIELLWGKCPKSMRNFIRHIVNPGEPLINHLYEIWQGGKGKCLEIWSYCSFASQKMRRKFSEQKYRNNTEQNCLVVVWRGNVTLTGALGAQRRGLTVLLASL